MPTPQEITKCCTSLVIIAIKPANHKDREKPGIREIQLTHFSIQIYLLSSKVKDTFAADLQEPTARVAIAETCLAYLLELEDKQPIEWLYNLYPLAEYAAKYWVVNAN